MSYSGRFLNAGMGVLSEHDWINDNWSAVLVDFAHIHADTLTLYSEISGNAVSDTSILSRSVNVVGIDTFLRCADINFGGTVSGKYIYIVHRAGGSLAANDKILAKIDLNDSINANIQVTAALQVQQNGLLQLPAAAA